MVNFSDNMNVTFRQNFSGSCMNAAKLDPKPIADSYKGKYEVTPSISAQVLDTAHKVMSKDVTIKSIPYYEVDNMQQGTTVIIGE